MLSTGFRSVLCHTSVDGVWMFFPDPWHKARHHKRRLLTTGFADLVAARMRPGGVVAACHRLGALCRPDPGRARRASGIPERASGGLGTTVGGPPDHPLREARHRRRPPYLRSRLSPGLSSLRALAAGHCLRRHRLLRLGSSTRPPHSSRRARGLAAQSPPPRLTGEPGLRRPYGRRGPCARTGGPRRPT